MNRSVTFGVFLIIIFTALPLYAQDEQISWKRSEEKTLEDLQLFHSTQSVNLPTTETLHQGNLEFEISHRFVPTIKSGGKTLYGFDGPVNMRLALGYAVTDKMVLTLGRSNLRDNVDLWWKYKFLEVHDASLPFAAAVRLGGAWNTEVADRAAGDSRNLQYFGQLIINTLVMKRLGIGIVPSYLDNSYIFTDDRQYSFTLGNYYQLYLSRLMSVLFEWNPVVTGFRTKNNPVSFGIELETGGHFFKIILTNSTLLNSSQFLAGTDNSFNSGQWHIGFNITRLLSL